MFNYTPATTVKTTRHRADLGRYVRKMRVICLHTQKCIDIIHVSHDEEFANTEMRLFYKWAIDQDKYKLQETYGD